MCMCMRMHAHAGSLDVREAGPQGYSHARLVVCGDLIKECRWLRALGIDAAFWQNK